MGTSIGNRAGGELLVCQLGKVPYSDAVAIQHDLHARRLSRELPDTLLLLEHPPTYTRARRSGPEDLPFGEKFYRERGIEVHPTDRGGRSTYHGPGQLVGYAIMHVDELQRFLRRMEDAIIAALADEGIAARSRHREGIDYTGVWVNDRKIGSIGLHLSRGVSTHGFAVNVDNDLEPFSWMIACGLPDVSMTSIARELNAEPSFERFRRVVAQRFCEAHLRTERLVSPERLGIDTAKAAGLAPAAPRPARAVPA